VERASKHEIAGFTEYFKIYQTNILEPPENTGHYSSLSTVEKRCAELVVYDENQLFL